LKSSERINLSLNFLEPDKVPIDMGGTQTGIHRTAYENLLKYLGLEDEIKIIDVNQQLAKPSEEILKFLNIDTRYVIPCQNIELKEVKPGYIGYKDIWGVIRGDKKEKKDILYFDIIENPLASAKINDLDYYDWPNPNDEKLFEYTKKEAKKLKESSGYAIVSKTVGVIFEACWKMRGMENFLIDLITDRPFAEKMLDIMTQYQVDYCEGYLKAAGEYLDVIFTGDDLGMQNGPIISPKIYRELIKPRQKIIFDKIHSLTKAKICYHTCGSVLDFIDDFIDVGIDFLNPVQTSALNMEPDILKSRFKNRIGFWGGGVDTQKVFPFGNRKDVIKDVKMRLKAFMPGGGFVFNSIHSIQPDVRAENIVAAFKTANDFGKY
jgi:uroporphyrinogen decarboxylase